MYFPNAASGNEWNRMATLSIRFYSLHPWVHGVLYKFVVFEIFVVEKSIRNFNGLTLTLAWKKNRYRRTQMRETRFPIDKHPNLLASREESENDSHMNCQKLFQDCVGFNC